MLLGGPMSKLDSCPCTGMNLPRYVQPVLLALLAREPMYGYSLIQTMSDLNLFSGNTPDVTGIYRKLRVHNTEGLLNVLSQLESNERSKLLAVS